MNNRFFLTAPLAKFIISLHFPNMTDKKNIPEKSASHENGKAKSEAAQARVAEALRANLRRRKEQSRDRNEDS